MTYFKKGNKMTRQEAIESGHVWYCLQCKTAYKKKPTEQYEDGHGGRRLEMCPCGCDLFDRLADNT
jgi:hypothetical protein